MRYAIFLIVPLAFMNFSCAGGVLKYRLPLADLEVNRALYVSAPDEFEKKIDFLRAKLIQQEGSADDNSSVSYDEAVAILVPDLVPEEAKKLFRELGREQVKNELQIPDNLFFGSLGQDIVTNERLQSFLKELGRFRIRQIRCAEAYRGVYLGFPKYYIEENGYDRTVKIVTHRDRVINLITPDGYLFPEKRGSFWWKFASDLIQGAAEQSGKEGLKGATKAIGF